MARKNRKATEGKYIASKPLPKVAFNPEERPMSGVTLNGGPVFASRWGGKV
jgi:hypothetical protein